MKMDKDIITNLIKKEGYVIKNNSIYTGRDEKLGDITDSKVEIIYGEFYLPSQVDDKIALAEDCEKLEIPYEEFLDKEEMKVLCGVRNTKKDLKDFMIRNARRFLSLAERVDDFEFK